MPTSSLRGARKVAPSRVSWTALVAIMERWLELRRERRRLLGLSDTMLHDIGLTRSEAEEEGLRWFWDVPERRR